MLFNRWKRNLREGFKNLGRNKVFTFASIATMTLCIFLIGLFFAIGFNIMTVLKNVESNVPITVFFDKTQTVENQQAFQENLRRDPAVKDTKYVSAEEAWENFKKIYFKDVPELADGFKDDNPLADSASLEVYLNNIRDQQDMVRKLESMEGVRTVKHSSDVADKLNAFNSAFSYIALVVIIILLFITIFLISNTVSIGISVRREEISIMQYVGAKDKFIRGPFVTEGLIIGIIGVLIPLALEYFLYAKALNYMSTHFELLSTVETFVPVNTIFKFFVPIALLIGVSIGFVASRFTVFRYLRK
ncbi:MAG: permease-like cell division protein FtsX [Eubacteriales bacterium]|nr:permease-like cell division protein FtsX [Eubacteriales bacterium]